MYIFEGKYLYSSIVLNKLRFQNHNTTPLIFLSKGLSKDFAKREVFLGIRKNLLFMREREGKTL